VLDFIDIVCYNLNTAINSVKNELTTHPRPLFGVISYCDSFKNSLLYVVIHKVKRRSLKRMAGATFIRSPNAANLSREQ